MRLGEILVQSGACSREAVADALKNQVIFGGRLGTNLLDLGAVREGDLARALGKRHGLPTLHGDLKLDPAAVALLRPEVADRYDVVPYVLQDRKLALLVCDPNDFSMLDEVAFVTGKQVHPIVVPEARLWALLRDTYGVDRQLRGIEVDFAGDIRAKPAPVQPAREDTVDSDLMDEAEFNRMYAKVGRAAAPPPPGRRPRSRSSTAGRGAPPAVAPPPAAAPTAAPTAAWATIPPLPRRGAEQWRNAPQAPQAASEDLRPKRSSSS